MPDGKELYSIEDGTIVLTDAAADLVPLNIAEKVTLESLLCHSKQTPSALEIRQQYEGSMDMLKLTTRYTPDEFNEFLEKVREKMEESKLIEPLRDHYDDDSAESKPLQALRLALLILTYPEHTEPDAGIMAEDESIRAKLNIGSLLIERLSPLLDVDNLPPRIWQNLSWASAFIGGLCALEIQLFNQTQTEGSPLIQDNYLTQQQTMPLYSFIRSLERTKPTQPTEQGLHRALHLVKTSMPSLSEETFSLIEQARIPRRGEIDSIHNPPPIDNT
jgi:hypothetical protein